MTPSRIPIAVTVRPAFSGPASIDLPTPIDSPSPNSITGENVPVLAGIAGTRFEVAPLRTAK